MKEYLFPSGCPLYIQLDFDQCPMLDNIPEEERPDFCADCIAQWTDCENKDK